MNKQCTVLLIALSSLTASFASTPAFASPQGGESIREVALNANQKSALVKFLKARLARHKKMTAAEIIADLDSQAQRNAAIAAAQGHDVASVRKIVSVQLDGLKALGDKEAILATEAAGIHKTMSSANIVFAITRAYIDECKYGPYYFSGNQAGCYAWAAFFCLFTVPADLIVLPFEIIGSLATGF